jgi:hypothetical protein
MHESPSPGSQSIPLPVLPELLLLVDEAPELEEPPLLEELDVPVPLLLDVLELPDEPPPSVPSPAGGPEGSFELHAATLKTKKIAEMPRIRASS